MCLDKKTPRLFYVPVCDNFHYTHTEYVTFNSDNDFFAPVQVYCNSRYNKPVNNDTHNLFDCLGLF